MYNFSRKATCRLQTKSPEEIETGSETKEWNLEMRMESGE